MHVCFFVFLAGRDSHKVEDSRFSFVPRRFAMEASCLKQLHREHGGGGSGSSWGGTEERTAAIRVNPLDSIIILRAFLFNVLKDILVSIKPRHKQKLETLLKELTPSREDIANAMLFCLGRADAAEEVVGLIADSFSLLQTPLQLKVCLLHQMMQMISNIPPFSFLTFVGPKLHRSLGCISCRTSCTTRVPKSPAHHIIVNSKRLCFRSASPPMLFFLLTVLVLSVLRQSYHRYLESLMQPTKTYRPGCRPNSLR